MENNEITNSTVKKRKTSLYLLIGILLIALIGVVIYYYINNNKGEKKDNSKKPENNEQTTKLTAAQANEIVEELFNNVYDKVNSDYENSEYSFWAGTETKIYENEEYECAKVQFGDLYLELDTNASEYFKNKYFVELDEEYYYCGWIDGLSEEELVNSIFSSTDVTDISITIDSFNDSEIIATIKSMNGTKTNATAKLTFKSAKYPSQVGGLAPTASWKITKIEEN